jgi:hypothetical protein
MALRPHKRKLQTIRVEPRSVGVEVERGGLAEQRAPEGAILLDGEVGEPSDEKVALDRCEIHCDERHVWVVQGAIDEARAPTGTD